MATLAVLFFSTAAAFAGNGASSSITITADKTEAEPGDTISFTVTLGPVSDFGTMQMVLVIPEGLTYEAGSGALADGLKETLGFDVADYTEISRMVNGFASAADYSSNGDTVLCTFRCTVNEGFKGSAEVGLTELEFYSCQNWKDHTGEYTVNKAVITVGSADDPAADPDPSGTTPDGQTPSGETTPDGQTPSGETTPDGQTPSGETTPDGQTPSGDTTPDGQTPSGETTPDPGKNGGNSDEKGKDGSESGDPGKNGSEGRTEPQEDAQRSFPWWIAAVAAVVVIAIFAIVFKRRKRGD